MKNFLLILVLVFITEFLLAQSRTLTGHVMNDSTGLPLGDVTVLVKGARMGVSTNAEGTVAAVPPSSTAYVWPISQDELLYNILMTTNA